MLHRKRNNGLNGPHWQVQPVGPIIPFPVRHSASPPGTVSPGLDLDLVLRLWPLPLVVVGVVEDAVEDFAVRRLLAIVLPQQTPIAATLWG